LVYWLVCKLSSAASASACVSASLKVTIFRRLKLYWVFAVVSALEKIKKDNDFEANTLIAVVPDWQIDGKLWSTASASACVSASLKVTIFRRLKLYWVFAVVSERMCVLR
jgi:hypothetical protein